MRVALDHCVIPVSDRPRSNAFDRDVTGAEVAEEARAHLDRQGVAVETGLVARHGARGAGASLSLRDPDGSLLEVIVDP